MPTNGIFGLAEFALHLKEIEREMNELGPAIIRRACMMVAAEAKRVLGKGYEDWPELKPETIARKMLGNSPLLETGEMRASIQWSTSHDGLEGHVGSNLDRAVYQELGTSRIPPRPFLAGALHHEVDAIVKMAGKAAHAVIAGRGLHGSSEFLELLHLLKHVGHEVNEAVQEFLDGPEDENKGRRR
jgi:HK97 gp10 family phage protein